MLIEKYNKDMEYAKDINRKTRLEIIERDPRNVNIISKNMAYLYAMRPLDETERAPELKFLSLYEFFPLLDNRACCLSIIRCRHRRGRYRWLSRQANSNGLEENS